MANEKVIDLDRLSRFHDNIKSNGLPLNNWQANKKYKVGYTVIQDGKLYRCKTEHTSTTTFDATKFDLVSGGGSGIQNWASNTSYSVGDLVVYGNGIYQCNTAHTSQVNFNSDASKWDEISVCITRIPNWQASTNYVVGDLVSYDAKIYRCINVHTSGNVWDSTEEANWEELSPTINEISLWATATDYAVGQLVIYNNKLYRCILANTSSNSFNSDTANWQEIGGSGNLNQWASNEIYFQGNTVIYNDKIYMCDTAHTSASSFDIAKWHEISANKLDSWAVLTDYFVDDMVVYDNQLYRCNTAHKSNYVSFYTDSNYWDILDTKWVAYSWTSGKLYIKNEVVLYDNIIYMCNNTHIAASTFLSDVSNWGRLDSNIPKWRSGNQYVVNDLVEYNGYLYRCLVNNSDTSFKRIRWYEVSKCCLGIWKMPMDSNVLALITFNDINNVGYNAVGDDFEATPKSTSSSGNLLKSDSVDGYGYSLSWLGAQHNLRSSYYAMSTTSSYTFEFFCKKLLNTYNPNNAGASVRLYVNTTGSPNTVADIIVFNSDKNGVFNYNNGGSSTLSVQTVLNSWKHIAIVITYYYIEVFFDGVSFGRLTLDNSIQAKFIYFRTSCGNNFTGNAMYIDSIRVSNVARYTSNFTPPTKFDEYDYGSGYKVNDLVVYNDKIYRALVDNNDTSFISSKWKEVSECVGINIENWVSGNNYSSGDLVKYNNIIYAVINNVTNASTTPDLSSDYSQMSGFSIASNSSINNLFI